MIHLSPRVISILRSIEWPTLAVAAAVYASFAALTLLHDVVPWLITLCLGGYVVAWHGSLQHEVVHGHPTPWPWLNEALVFPSLWLWLPFRCYRVDHHVHHRDQHLTDPGRDPESWYLPTQTWQRMSRRQRAFRTLIDTSAGRLLIAPFWVVLNFASGSLRTLMAGRLDVRAWALHLSGVACVLAWVVAVCDIPIFEYVMLYVYPGIALTLLRSFAEHRAHPDVGHRICVVEAHPLLALLYLNNNLHPTHHGHPKTAWYRLPRLWREQRDAFVSKHSECVFNGYSDVLRRFAFAPRVTHPWLLPDTERTEVLEPLSQPATIGRRS